MALQKPQKGMTSSEKDRFSRTWRYGSSDGKECHQGCEIMKQVGSCIMPTQGIFGKVLKTGTIHVGDEVSIIK